MNVIFWSMDSILKFDLDRIFRRRFREFIQTILEDKQYKQENSAVRAASRSTIDI